jgi:hypothetical protein
MSANQRKNKNKKKKTVESKDCHSTGSAVINHVNEPTVSLTSLSVDVLFTGRKGSSTSSNKIYMCAGDMKSLGLTPGGYVHVAINPDEGSVTDEEASLDWCCGKSVVCQAWSSSELMKNAAALTRFWQPNFPDDSRRDIKISQLTALASVQECVTATFSILLPATPPIDDEVTASSAFRRYFAAALCDTVLCVGNSFTLSWRAELITAKVSE